MKKPKRSLISSQFKATAVATSLSAALALFSPSADAATMGRLSVWSGLGQPLRAEVEVSATPEEQGTLIARVATPDMYRQAGLEYSSAISGLRVLVDRRGARPVIRISSEAPMREAFLDILLELSWSNGRLAREYTVLLDPVDAPSGGRGAAGGALAPPVALPETRMSYSLSQRGAPEGKPSLPPPGSGGQMPQMADQSSRGAPAAKPLPSLRPNYAAAPSEARLVPAAPPMPAAPAAALDPRATAKLRQVPETPAAPPVQVAAPAPVPAPAPTPVAAAPVPRPAPQVAAAPPPAPLPAPAPTPAPAPEPRRELKAEPKVEQKPAPIAAPRELRAPEAPPTRIAPPTPEPRPATPEKSLPTPKTLAQLEEELRAAERSQQQERGSGKKATKVAAEEKPQADKKGKGKGKARDQEPASETAKEGSAPNTYSVQRGDTLMKIARETKPEEVSLDQMLVALFRNNEAAFEGNMNRMKTGRILNLPDPEKVAEVPKGKAHREVIAQSIDFAAYRNKLAEIAKGGLGKDDTAQQVASGKILPKVEETKPAPISKDQLKLTRTLSGKGGKTASAEAGRKAAFEEDAVARERALKEANQRVTELEQNIKNLQSLIELKNRSMSELQRQAKGGPAASPQADAAKVAKPEAAGAGLPVNGGKMAASGAGGVSAQSDPKAEATSQTKGGGEKAAATADADGESLRGKDLVADQKPADKAKATNVLSALTHPAVWGSVAGLGTLLLGWFGFSLLRTRSKVTTLRPMKEATAEPTDSLAERLRSARESMQASRKEDGLKAVRPVKVDGSQIDDPVVMGTALPAVPIETVVVVDTPRADSAPEDLPVSSMQVAPVVPRLAVPVPELLAEPVSEPQTEPVVDLVVPTVEVPLVAEPRLESQQATAQMSAAVAAAVDEPSLDALLEKALGSALDAAEPAKAAKPSPMTLDDFWQTDVAPVVSEEKETVPKVVAAAVAPTPAPVVGELTANPRTSIHLELLRLYAQRKELEQFDALAHELHRLSGGEGADWTEAACLGRSIDPANPIYATNAPAVTIPVALAQLSPAADASLAPVSVQVIQPEPEITTMPAVAAVEMPDASKGVDFDFGDFSTSPPAQAKTVTPDVKPASVVPVTPATPVAAQAQEPVVPLVAKPVDLSGIDFDLPKQNEVVSKQAPPVAAEPKLDDVGAKLELARAYREMGDVEGARELLTEVVQEGTAAQQAAAREILSKLG